MLLEAFLYTHITERKVLIYHRTKDKVSLTFRFSKEILNGKAAVQCLIKWGGEEIGTLEKSVKYVITS